jgi:nucleoid-associated protein EbfC
MSDFSQILQLGQQMQGRMTQMQTELTQRTVTGSAGGGMVTATADGRGHIRAIKVDPKIFEDGDPEMIEDLVLAAVSEAQRRAEEIYRDELKKVTGGLPLPFQFPL